MKTLAIQDNPNVGRLSVERPRNLSAKLTSYFGAQATVQLANILTGFLLIRALDKSQYGWFTIVTGAMAMISVLADSGLGSAFTAIGGKTYQEPGVFAGLAAFMRRKRLQFLIVACGLVLPVNAWALHKNGASPATTVILLTLIVIAAIPSTDAVVLMTVNKLFSRVRNIVLADLLLSLSKLGLVLFVCWLGASTISATICVLCSLWFQITLLQRQTSDVLKTEVCSVDEYVPQINQTVLHVLPTCIFTCVQAQLATYILSFFASVEQVADLGALMRLAVAFTFLTIPLQQIFLPRIARCQDRARLKISIVGTLIGGAVAALAVVITGSLFAPWLLMLLGEKYAHLDHELLIFLAVTALGFLASAAWGIAFTRAWVMHGWANIPIAIALQIAIAPFIDFTQVSGVIVFASVSHLASFAVAGWLIVTGYRREFSQTV